MGNTNAPLRPVLLLRLEGPLQSWGGRSRWDVRDTAREPGKSAIIGLLGCALGYPARDPRLEELDRLLRYGLRVEAPGRVMEDYQTITDYLPTADGRYKHSGVAVGANLAGIRNNPDASPATILSPRFYLEDAAFLVGFEANAGGDELLARCADAVRDPRWPLFLGRKTCVPTRPLFAYSGSNYKGLEDALKHHPWDWRTARRAPKASVTEPTEELIIYIEQIDGQYARQDALRINAARQYGTVRYHRFPTSRTATGVLTADAPCDPVSEPPAPARKES